MYSAISGLSRGPFPHASPLSLLCWFSIISTSPSPLCSEEEKSYLIHNSGCQKMRAGKRAALFHIFRDEAHDKGEPYPLSALCWLLISWLTVNLSVLFPLCFLEGGQGNYETYVSSSAVYPRPQDKLLFYLPFHAFYCALHDLKHWSLKMHGKEAHPLIVLKKYPHRMGGCSATMEPLKGRVRQGDLQMSLRGDTDYGEHLNTSDTSLSDKWCLEGQRV